MKFTFSVAGRYRAHDDSSADPSLAPLIASGLNDKFLIAPQLHSPLEDHWVVKTTKLRSPDLLAREIFPDAPQQLATSYRPEELAAFLQDLYIESDFVAVLMSCVTRELFPIAVPEAVLHIDAVTPKHECLTTKNKVIPRSRIISRLLPGYREPFPKKAAILARTADGNTPVIWQGQPPLTRAQLDLNPAENRMLGDLFAYACIMGFNDAVNNIDLSNAGFCRGRTAVVDLGLALGWGLGGTCADSNLFRGAENCPLTGYADVEPFDRRVYFGLPRMVCGDLFDMSVPDLREGFVATVTAAHRRLQTDSLAICRGLDRAFSRLTLESSISPEDLRKRLHQRFYASNPTDPQAMCHILRARVTDAFDVATAIAASPHDAADIIARHNANVASEFDGTQARRVSQPPLTGTSTRRRDSPRSSA